MVKQPYSYDGACETLAEHFLSTVAERDAVKELAQHIQDAVEDWFQYIADKPVARAKDKSRNSLRSE
jgi:hypothetical protein